MKFWLSILFFLSEGALLAYGMVKAVGNDKTPSSFLPLIIALLVVTAMFAKLGCLDNAPKRDH